MCKWEYSRQGRRGTEYREHTACSSSPDWRAVTEYRERTRDARILINAAKTALSFNDLDKSNNKRPMSRRDGVPPKPVAANPGERQPGPRAP